MLQPLLPMPTTMPPLQQQHLQLQQEDTIPLQQQQAMGPQALPLQAMVLQLLLESPLPSCPQLHRQVLPPI